MGPSLSLTPDQFAGVVDRHDHDDKGEGTIERADHPTGHRIECRAVLFRAQDQAAQSIEQTQQ